MALLRGDIGMAWRYRINEGYCYIHGGKPNRGKRVIHHMLGDVMVRSRSERGSEGGLSKLAVVRNMCLGTLRFANQIRETGCGSLRDDGQHQ